MEESRGRSGPFPALGGAVSTSDLRRLQLGTALAAVGGWVVFVTLAVYAFDRGGAFAVGATALVRMAPAGIAAPFVGVLVDRHSRRDVLLVSCLARALVLIGIAAAALLSAPFSVVLVLAALFTTAMTAHKPAQAALLPSLAETPRQLAACNVLWGGLDSAAFLVGALLSGSFIVLVGVNQVFLVTSALFAIAAFPIAGIRRDAVPKYRATANGIHAARDALEGLRKVTADHRVRVVLAVLSLSTVVEGVVDVLVVLLAIHVLGLGGSGVGWLNACWGVGGVAGGAAALSLLGRGRLAAGLASGSLLVGASLMLVGAVASVVVTPPLLVLLGVGYALIETAGMSLIQRLASGDLLGRAFAVAESSYWITTGIGAVLAPVIVHLLGVRGALVVVGGCLPALAVVRWSVLARLEAGAAVPERSFNALRRVSLFEPLPLATIENVSRQVAELEVPDGETIIREGDYGDRFYVVAQGVLDVNCEGGALPPLTAGDFFGEIALIHDIPRTATVTARHGCRLYALDRESFLRAITNHSFSTHSAHEVASERLTRAPLA